MASGFKIADAYVAVTLNRDQLRTDLADLPAEMTPAVEKAAEEAGNKGGASLGKGMRDGAQGEKLGKDVVGDIEAAATPEADKAGRNVGDKMSKAMADAQSQGSGLVVAAVAAGLAAGGPAILGAAGLLFGGIAAAAVSSNAQVSAAFTAMEKGAEDAIKGAASVTVPMFLSAIAQIDAGVQQLTPMMTKAFAGLGPAISDVAGGITQLATNAMPGIITAIGNSGPVFDGLQKMLSTIGTGISDMFTALSKGAPAFGQVFSSLGDAVGAILPAIGELLTAGGQVASAVLPVLVKFFEGLAAALHLVAPVLPEVVAAIGGLKIASMLSGPLETLASKLSDMGTMGTRAGVGVLSISSALPGLLAGVTVLGTIWASSNQQISTWATALEQGGQAAATATKQLSDAHTRSIADAHSLSDAWGIVKGAFSDGAAQVEGYSSAQDKANQEAKAAYQALTPLQQKQQDVTTAQNNLNYAVGKWGGESSQAADAAKDYANKQAALASAQQQATDAASRAAAAMPGSTQQLQELANEAQSANSQINLLKGALDALTGKTVSEMDAEAAVTNAVTAATSAMKNKTGALVDSTGAINLNTDAGAAAEQGLKQLRDSDNQLISTMEQHGKTSGEVAAKDAQLRDQFIQTAQKMGFSASQAKNLADQILGIPSERKTTITADTSQASAAAAALVSRINSMAATIQVRAALPDLNGAVSGTGRMGTYAQGAIVHAFAGGGFEPNMSAGIADIVAPQTYRLIGDRVTDDEAYIPLDSSQRSLQILAESARRMGQTVAPATPAMGAMGGGGAMSTASGGGGNKTVNLNLYGDMHSPVDVDQLMNTLTFASTRL